MSTTTLYRMAPLPEQADVLERALIALAAQLTDLPGSEGVQLYRQTDDDTFLLIEHWSSDISQTAAGATLGKEVFSSVFSAAVKPIGQQRLKCLVR